MNKKFVKIISIILLVIIILLVMNNVVYADTKSVSQAMGDGRTWIHYAEEKSTINPGKVGEILRPIANILLAIGSVVIVIVGAVIAIKYLTSSPDGKGKLKAQLVGVFVSAVVLYGAYGIWSIVYTVLKDIVG